MQEKSDTKLKKMYFLRLVGTFCATCTATGFHSRVTDIFLFIFEKFVYFRVNCDTKLGFSCGKVLQLISVLS